MLQELQVCKLFRLNGLFKGSIFSRLLTCFYDQCSNSCLMYTGYWLPAAQLPEGELPCQ